VTEVLKPEICIVGAGAAGLSVAAAAAAIGVPTVLIEKGRMGGQRLNTACMPSKALIAAGKRAALHRDSPRFGLHAPPADVDFDQVNQHIHRAIDSIAPNDARERFAGLGVRVLDGTARFRDPRTIVIRPEQNVTHQIEARCFVLATGSSPVVPDIPGLDQVPYFTNETIFDLRERPGHLIILGAGPNSLELAQAFRRLGSEVTVFEREQALPGEDPECSAIVLDALARDGVTVRTGVKVERLRRLRQRIEVVLEGEEVIHGTDLLIAVGRRPNIDNLDLKAGQVQHEPAGILINKRFRTSNKRVYAIGDVTGLPPFTHAAQHEASLLIRHLLFRAPLAMNLDRIPRVIFTDPELAQVGLTVEQARERHGAIQVLRWSYRDNDRAQAEGEIRGHIKVVTDGKGAILGATIVGAAAAEQITCWTLAIANGLNVRAFAEIVMPYPTYSEVGKRAAVSFFTPRLATSWVGRLLNSVRRFG